MTSNTPKDGGPAYPSSNDVQIGDIGTSGHAGMSLLDHFAGRALTGVLSNLSEVDTEVLAHKDIAWLSYDIAKAMLKARGEQGEGD